MLLAAFIITGIAVGAGVPASWTYIAEQAPSVQRAKHVGTAQLAWSIGPLIGFALAAALAPLGLLGSRLIFLHLFVVAAVVWWIRQGLAESQIWQDEGQHETASVASAVGVRGIRGLFSRKVNITALLFLGGIYLFWNTVAGQAGIFMPRVYDTAGLHSAVQQNLLQVLVWGCTVAATYFGFMRFADRMSQRLLYVDRRGAGHRRLDRAGRLHRQRHADHAGLRGAVGHLQRHRRPGLLQPVGQRAVRHARTGPAPRA